MLFDFGAHAVNLPFGDDITTAEQDHLIGDGVHFVQDVARDDHVLPFLSQRELRYVRKNRDTREFRMLHLIHARLRGILGLTTVADHLFGAAFVRSQKSGLRTNPLTP